MKKFIIIYSIASFLLLIMVIFISSYNSYLSRIIDIYDDVSHTSAQSGDFDNYLALQTNYFQKISEVTSEDYQFSIYLSLGQSDASDLYQLSIYVLPINEVLYATNINDEDDQTNIIFTNDENAVLYALNEDDEFSGEAISYGIETLGFYYATLELNSFYQIHIEVLDYDGQSIYQTAYNYQNYLDINDETTMMGFDDETFDQMVDFNTYVIPGILSNVLVYLIVDILLGSGIYLYKKKSKKL